MIGVLIVTLWVWAVSVLGYPVSTRPLPPSSAQECASIDTSTVEYFLKEASKRKGIDLPLDNALFYTKGMSKMAKDYACEHDLITIWHVWKTWHYESRDNPANKMRCIHNNERLRQQFFESMSEAYARLADGTVIVMHNASD